MEKVTLPEEVKPRLDTAGLKELNQWIDKGLHSMTVNRVKCLETKKLARALETIEQVRLRGKLNNDNNLVLAQILDLLEAVLHGEIQALNL